MKTISLKLLPLSLLILTAVSVAALADDTDPLVVSGPVSFQALPQEGSPIDPRFQNDNQIILKMRNNIRAQAANQCMHSNKPGGDGSDNLILDETKPIEIKDLSCTGDRVTKLSCKATYQASCVAAPSDRTVGDDAPPAAPKKANKASTGYYAAPSTDGESAHGGAAAH